MIIRLRSPDGQARITLSNDHSLNTIKHLVAKAFNYSADENGISLFLDPAGKQPVTQTYLASIKHGDMLFVKVESSAMDVDDEQQHDIRDEQSAMKTATTAKTGSRISPALVKQDPMDDFLEKQEGTIKRGHSSFCRHGPSGMCDQCTPLEPYDAKYLEENKIKHMSFHAYLRRACDQNKTAPVTSSAFIAPLDEPSFKVVEPCPSRTHGPYPQGICTKCQPSAVTLTGQEFRMVDHVEFSAPHIVERFISFWRQTGCQRFGLLYGRYEPYSEVPLGVKAVVEAIYEPPQDSAPDAIQLTLPNPQASTVDGCVRRLGLKLVGMIYTDLMDDGSNQGTVVCKRHAGSFFLSSAEVLFSAEYQSQHPTISKYSSSVPPPPVHSALSTKPTTRAQQPQFGSRFVTVVVSGNAEGGIDLSCYQVSNVGCAMARDGVIEASVEPGMMRVKASTGEQYVPEVFYKHKNEYGIMVKEAAKPTFPVEYVLVTLSHGFVTESTPLFRAAKPFPISNRQVATDEPHPSLSALKSHLSSASLFNELSDFHLSLFLAESGILDEQDLARQAYVAVLGAGAGKAEAEQKLAELVASGGWQTLMVLANENVSSESGSGSSRGIGDGSASKATRIRDPWTCRHCTFVNIGGDSCEVCGLPADG